MDLEPLSIRFADAVAITRFADHRIRKLIRSGELKAVRIGRVVLIDYRHFKAFCERHRQTEIRSQKVVILRWPHPGRRAM
jgi:excisionase family DNA binding protein